VTLENHVTHEVWRDPSAPARERVADLIARMTVREKIAQLYGVWVGMDAAGGDVAPHQHDFASAPTNWNELISDGIGQLTRPSGTTSFDPTVGARGIARSQRQIMAAGRFGIPAVVHEECLTGLAAWQATVYPSPLSWGASFDPQLVERSELGACETRDERLHHPLAPFDIARHRAGVIEAWREREAARDRHKAEAGLEAGHAAARGRDPDRAA